MLDQIWSFLGITDTSSTPPTVHHHHHQQQQQQQQQQGHDDTDDERQSVKTAVQQNEHGHISPAMTESSTAETTETIEAGTQCSAQESERVRLQLIKVAQYLSTAKPRQSTVKRIVENVRQASELIVWSDRRNRELLSFAIEMGLHQSMKRLLCTPRQNAHVSRAITVQILQTLSIVLDGVSDARFLYSVFSNNFVNELIAAPIDVEDDEILAYYVAFLKALSLKLTPDTIHFFFNERLDDFPLYTTAISLFDHPDSMVRVAVRAITLNVFRINDRDALEFILDAPACAHFWQVIVRAIKDCYDDAFRILIDKCAMEQGALAVATTAVNTREMSAVQEWAAIDQILENHMGLLAYLNDIYALGVERINQRITAEVTDRIVARTFVHVIELGWRAEASREEALFMQIVTLFLAHFFALIKHAPLLVDTLTVLFVPDPQRYLGDGTLALGRPFVPSPFEPSRTLMPWLCVALEVLANKAIGPTVLVKSVFTPRCMLRTRTLLESLTGESVGPEARSAGSAITVSPPAGSSLPLPEPSQAITTELVQILAESPPSHTALAIDLAAALLVRLAAGARGSIELDRSLMDEIAVARGKRAGEVKAMLLTCDDEQESGVSWKLFVKCLVDLANISADVLRNKIESEIRHIFSADGQCARVSSSNCSSGIASPASQLSLVSSASSPFDRAVSSDSALLASTHQAFHLKLVERSAHQPPIKPLPTEYLYADDLRAWALGTTQCLDALVDGADKNAVRAIVADNQLKRHLPRGTAKLGFDATVVCTHGKLIVYDSLGGSTEPTTPVLVWPLADVIVEDCDHEILLTDSPFPSLFYPPRPKALGGLSVNNSILPDMRRRRANPAKLQYAYFSNTKSLDLSVRFSTREDCEWFATRLSCAVVESRKALAAIFFDHDVI